MQYGSRTWNSWWGGEQFGSEKLMWGRVVGEKMKRIRRIYWYEDPMMKTFISILHANVQIILKYV